MQPIKILIFANGLEILESVIKKVEDIKKNHPNAIISIEVKNP